MDASITCPKCGMTSYLPHDVREGYCGNCHEWTGAFADLTHVEVPNWIDQYDRQGHPVSFARGLWLHAQPGYERIAETYVGSLRVSTVWLGTSIGRHNPPLIFETLAFSESDIEDADRYATEDEARAGHERIVARLRARLN